MRGPLEAVALDRLTLLRLLHLLDRGRRLLRRRRVVGDEARRRGRGAERGLPEALLLALEGRGEEAEGPGAVDRPHPRGLHLGDRDPFPGLGQAVGHGTTSAA